MKKILEVVIIDKCINCPNFSTKCGGQHCLLTGKNIPNDKKADCNGWKEIPYFCPLKTYQEAEKREG